MIGQYDSKRWYLEWSYGHSVQVEREPATARADPQRRDPDSFLQRSKLTEV